MNLQELREQKRQKGYSNEELAKLSGVPLGTVQKVMSGATRNPRRKTLAALEQVLTEGKVSVETADMSVSYGNIIAAQEPSLVREAATVYQTERKVYTMEDIYALPDGVRAELIDGQMYMMAPPNTRHQEIIFSLSRKIADYIDGKMGGCKVYLAPFAVFLNADDRNYVEPDISVICDKRKIDENGCNGAPDWVVEVVSPGSRHMDYMTKLFKYRTAGVREYWIVDDKKQRVTVYNFERDYIAEYTFDESVTVGIYDDLKIDLGALI